MENIVSGGVAQQDGRLQVKDLVSLKASSSMGVLSLFLFLKIQYCIEYVAYIYR